MRLEHDADLTRLNTFGVRARTAVLAQFSSLDELRGLLAAPELKQRPRLVLGGGSNVLFTRDWPGVVLLNEIPGIALEREDEEHVWLRSGAGVVWNDLVMYTVERGWGGIENLSLIPGKVGAAPMQNIGAYGVELKDTFSALEALRLEDGAVVEFHAAECRFGYRESFFKHEGRDRFIITSLTLRLKKHGAPNTAYGAIRDVLAERGITDPTVRDVSEAVMNIRRSKLPDPAELGNAGSFFKNPMVPMAQAEALRRKHPGLVSYPAPGGLVKVAAGWLIEQAGWKGRYSGACGVHQDQALVLVNRGGASGQAIYDLSEQVLRSVWDRFGIALEREVNII
ncbi:MAG: UDP-N-acetylmuramate dehydrogenase [Flavobacteriales bacterium]|nr:UDP-N-acetylmuramate dehydrogenase [Flavobacteriales bacterium]MCB9167675.1 UDP-N-acetylmuramate dehydrogenase [Flavobacteriales bacterium]